MRQGELHGRKKRPLGGSGSSVETEDITSQNPPIDDILDEIDNALRMADNIEESLGRGREESLLRRCGC